jgi:hypothetical protein
VEAFVSNMFMLLLSGKSLSIGQKNGVFTQQVTFHITTGKPL